MFEDFSLGGFLGSIDDTLMEAGLGGTSGLIETIGAGTQSSNVSNAQATKYQNIQQRTSTPTSSSLPFDKNYLIYGGVGLVALVLIVKS